MRYLKWLNLIPLIMFFIVDKLRGTEDIMARMEISGFTLIRLKIQSWIQRFLWMLTMNTFRLGTTLIFGE